MAESTMVADLAKVQGSLPSFKKDAKGGFGEYITLDQVMEKVLPLLSKNNLAWVTMPGYDEGGNAVLNYQLLHGSGEKIEGSMHLYLDKQNSQGLGSAITYARRYAITAMLGITADVDDDGAKASTSNTPIKKVESKLEKPSDYNHDLEKLKIQARTLMSEHGYIKEKAGEFLQTVISKDKPVTKQDYTDIIEALNEA